MNYRISIIYFINLNNFLKFLEKVKSDGTIVPVRITNRDESHGSIVPVRITNRDESLSALRRRTGHVPPHSSRLVSQPGLAFVPIELSRLGNRDQWAKPTGTKGVFSTSAG